jgi:hypothetical protein
MNFLHSEEGNLRGLVIKALTLLCQRQNLELLSLVFISAVPFVFSKNKWENNRSNAVASIYHRQPEYPKSSTVIPVSTQPPPRKHYTGSTRQVSRLDYASRHRQIEYYPMRLIRCSGNRHQTGLSIVKPSELPGAAESPGAPVIVVFTHAKLHASTLF